MASRSPRTCRPRSTSSNDCRSTHLLCEFPTTAVEHSTAVVISGAFRQARRPRLDDSMIIKVLGSAAGGGFPQWNCNCRNCAAVRAGTPGFRARTQSSLAVSRDGVSWVLLNASPDLRQQINETPALHADPEARAAPQPHQGRRPHQRRRRPHHRPDQPARGAALLDLRLATACSASLKSNSVFQVLAEPLVPRIDAAARQADRAQGRRRRSRPDGRSLRRAGQGRALSRGRVCRQRLRQPGGRHHRPQGHRSGRPRSRSSIFPAAPTIDEHAGASASRAPPSSSSTARCSPTTR